LDIQSEISDLKNSKKEKASGTSILKKVPFSAVSRWEVAYILREGKLESVYNSFKCPMYSISQLQTESLFGLSIKASTTQKKGMIPMIRMPNIVNGEIDCSDMKYLPYKCAVTDKEPDKWLLRKGDFLINRTNSKELVGKSAVFNLEGDFTYASYVIRYRFDTSIVLPEYINILFMLPIVRIQIDTVSRQTAGQCNINSDEIGAIRIPIPSIPKQQAIIDKYYSTKDGSNAYYDKAHELREKAASDFEKRIFS
jgi:type I restriction enzyme S subunit